jgi:hypothetical protein
MSPQSRLCTCSMHCPESGYHEKACCETVWCDCFCHEGRRTETEEIFRSRYFARQRQAREEWERKQGPRLYRVGRPGTGELGAVFFDLAELPIDHAAVIWIVTDRPPELAVAC